MNTTPVKTTDNRKGFTLLELSIVLVIIGLIVGGVLVGQDLIKAAEIRATVGQYEKYNTALNTFRSKYNGIPGDLLSSQASAFGLAGFDSNDGSDWDGGAAGLGDGNGQVESGTNAAAQTGEPLVFWYQLSQASLVDGSYASGTALSTVGAASGTSPATYLPLTKLGRGNYWMTGSDSGQNYYLVGAVSAISGTDATITEDKGLTPAEAYNMDVKIDDGLPNAGIVQARGNATISDTLFASLSTANISAFATTDTANTCQIGGSGSTGASNTYDRGSAGGNSPVCQLRLRFN